MGRLIKSFDISKIRLLTFLFWALLSFGNYVFSQELTFVLTNEKGRVVPGTTIQKNNQKEQYNSNGYVSLSVEKSDTIVFTNSVYESVTYIVKDQDLVDSSQFIFIVFTFKTQEYDEVIITSKRLKEYYDQENSYIIDYYPLKEYTLLLIKKNRLYKLELFIGSEIIETTHLQFKARALQYDAMDNFHVLSDDSSYQIFIEDQKVQLLKPISLKDYENHIEPVVVKSNDQIFRQVKSRFKMKYSLEKWKNQQRELVYTSFDTVKFKHLLTQRNKIIGMYYAATTLQENFIENGVWDGSMTQLAHTNEIMEEVGWYKMFFDQPIKCYAFGMNDKIVLIDLFQNRVKSYDYDHVELSKGFSLDSNICFSVNAIYNDPQTERIYLSTRDMSGYHFYSVNFREEALSHLKGLVIPPHVENVKFSGDWIYFLVTEESGFNRIERQKNDLKQQNIPIDQY